MFEEVVLKGLASDGGLFIPESIPGLPENWFTAWRDLSYSDLAYEILSLYISPSEIPPQDLRELITRSYSTFRHPAVTPTRPLHYKEANGDHSAPRTYLLELFHGPTFAFKDVALQFLGNLFEYFLLRKNAGKPATSQRHHLTVLGATSGDTGSAAIYGLRGKQDVSVFILHPKGRITPIQQAQMTTVLDKNVHNIAVAGAFDDCQDIVKSLFSDPEFNKSHNLAAVNSINWARILAQIPYYFYSYLSICPRNLTAPDHTAFDPEYIVPTGNFGDILAGYFAKQMGLPISHLGVATNANDILDRFVHSGIYEKHSTPDSRVLGSTTNDGDTGGVKETLSPAMDVLISSNFERLLWYLAFEAESDGTRTGAGATVCHWMKQFKDTGRLQVGQSALSACRRDFYSRAVSDAETVETIKAQYQKDGYILDPHTSVGWTTMKHIIQTGDWPKQRCWVTLSTAHPAKFSGAVDLALGDIEGYSFEGKVRPEEFVGLEQRERRFKVVDTVDAELVKKVIEEGLVAERV